MAGLLPSSSDTSAVDEAEPRVIGLDSDGADELLSALSSETSREILAALHEDPDTPSAVADRVDTSLQNAQYHLGNLHDAGLIDVVDTVYSEKGREMKVYAPADKPLVVFAGSESESDGLQSALKSLLGGVAVLGVVSALVQFYLRGLPFGTAAGGADVSTTGDAGGGQMGTMAVETAASTGPQIPPGLLVFLGGFVVLAVLTGVWYVRRR
ncbi:ArsR/SmtB family transcription factor [Haloplanus sp. GCM10025708]|uniref:ArsR/SmtB family transcription factor n=1 Tax=Haloferacaceae TaxID=1644056 RepID=UPI0036131DB0